MAGNLIKNRIFIVGCPRSGTTLLQGLLNAHEGITSFTESHFFDFGIKQPKGGSFYYVNKNNKELVLSFLSENNINRSLQKAILEHLPPFSAFPGKYVNEWSKFFIYLLDTITIERGKDIWLEKTPDHLNRVEIIGRRIPDAVFLHIIRDGRDVVASLYRASKIWKKNYSIQQCIDYWNSAINKTKKLLEKPNHHLIVYEQLVSDYDKIVNSLFEMIRLKKMNNLQKVYNASVKQIIGHKESWKENNFLRIKIRSTFSDTFDKDEQTFIESALNLDIYEELKQV